MNKYDIDYEDTKRLWNFAMETCRIAEELYHARERYAVALKALKLELAKKYRDKLIDKKHSEDKAYLILAEESEEAKEHLRQLIHEENQYKGLEKVLEARQSVLNFNQSLLRYKNKEG